MRSENASNPLNHTRLTVPPNTRMKDSNKIKHKLSKTSIKNTINGNLKQILESSDEVAHKKLRNRTFLAKDSHITLYFQIFCHSAPTSQQRYPLEVPFESKYPYFLPV